MHSVVSFGLYLFHKIIFVIPYFRISSIIWMLDIIINFVLDTIILINTNAIFTKSELILFMDDKCNSRNTTP